MTQLTELMYSNDRKGPFRLYIYGQDGLHSGGQWVNRVIKYPDEEIDCQEMMVRTMEAAAEGREVRICDGGDMLVYHCVGANILYPDKEAMHTFWNEIVG